MNLNINQNYSTRFWVIITELIKSELKSNNKFIVDYNKSNNYTCLTKHPTPYSD